MKLFVTWERSLSLHNKQDDDRTLWSTHKYLKSWMYKVYKHLILCQFWWRWSFKLSMLAYQHLVTMVQLISQPFESCNYEAEKQTVWVASLCLVSIASMFWWGDAINLKVMLMKYEFRDLWCVKGLKVRVSFVHCLASVRTYPTMFDIFIVLTQHIAYDWFDTDSTNKSTYEVFQLMNIYTLKDLDCNCMFGRHWCKVVVWRTTFYL